MSTLSKILKKILIISPFIFADFGSADATTFIAGMGRSGTTWIQDIINYKHDYRIIFEPFHPFRLTDASCFQFYEYIRPETADPTLEKQARIILSGHVRNSWVDRNKKISIYRKRIIKDIRCNLMIGWLKKLLPNMPMVLLIRHPLSVIYSWENLNWGDADGGERTDFELITSQKELLDDYPVIRKALHEIDKSSVLETTLFIWCVLYYVPFKQFNPGDVFILSYEEAVLNPEPTFTALFNFLGAELHWNEISIILNNASDTDFLRRDFSLKDKILFSWKSKYSDEELKRVNFILEMFGLESIYDRDGLPAKDLQSFLNS